jgi:hypothetical protein
VGCAEATATRYADARIAKFTTITAKTGQHAIVVVVIVVLVVMA